LGAWSIFEGLCPLIPPKNRLSCYKVLLNNSKYVEEKTVTCIRTRMIDTKEESTRLRARKPPPTPKVVRDSNPDFRINPDSDPDVCRIAPEMLWIHYLVGVSHFTECREKC